MIFTVLFLCWGHVCVFYTQTGDMHVKIQMSTANDLFFQIKTCGFHLLEEREGVGGGDVPALAVW